MKAEDRRYFFIEGFALNNFACSGGRRENVKGKFMWDKITIQRRDCETFFSD